MRVRVSARAVFGGPFGSGDVSALLCASMSETIARVYTNTSRRASRKQPADHRAVYRSVLGNPFHVDW
jgi:hypothetical protein